MSIKSILHSIWNMLVEPSEEEAAAQEILLLEEEILDLIEAGAHRRAIQSAYINWLSEHYPTKFVEVQQQLTSLRNAAKGK